MEGWVDEVSDPDVQEALDALVESVGSMPHQRTYSYREEPVPGAVKGRGYERRCIECYAAFFPLSPGATGKVGHWTEKGWYCSTRCFDTHYIPKDAASTSREEA